MFPVCTDYLKSINFITDSNTGQLEAASFDARNKFWKQSAEIRIGMLTHCLGLNFNEFFVNLASHNPNAFKVFIDAPDCLWSGYERFDEIRFRRALCDAMKHLSSSEKLEIVSAIMQASYNIQSSFKTFVKDNLSTEQVQGFLDFYCKPPENQLSPEPSYQTLWAVLSPPQRKQFNIQVLCPLTYTNPEHLKEIAILLTELPDTFWKQVPKTCFNITNSLNDPDMWSLLDPLQKKRFVKASYLYMSYWGDFVDSLSDEVLLPALQQTKAGSEMTAKVWEVLSPEYRHKLLIIIYTGGKWALLAEVLKKMKAKHIQYLKNAVDWEFNTIRKAIRWHISIHDRAALKRLKFHNALDCRMC